MKDEINEGINEHPDQDGTETGVSRREFLTKSTGTIAAAGTIAAGASLVSDKASAPWPDKSNVSIPSDLQSVVDENPDIGAIVLECTDLAPFAYAIQEATRLPAYDCITMAKFMHEGAMQKPHTGWL